MTGAPNEVLVRVEASPINPSDLGVLMPGADMSTASVSGTPEHPVVTATLGEVPCKGFRRESTSRFRWATKGRAPSSRRDRQQPRPLSARQWESPAPALVHTAAASNLGQMLVKLCIADGVPLVNIVRKPDQEELLRSLGAVYVCNTSAPSFSKDLVEALTATSATIAFDATGGGTLASQILSGMEKAASATAKEYSRYGSAVHKQVYIYGGLDTSPTTLIRDFGMAWGVGGWLLTPFLQSIGAEAFGRLRARVAAELTTTFASAYTREVSLVGMLQPDAFHAYVKRATGEKFLVTRQA